MEEMYKDFTLLEDGKNAFNEILNCIDNSKEYIKINMFIWRDDLMGNKIASSILKAASRGVKVELDIDRYGIVLENAEESKSSFFHKDINKKEAFNAKALEVIYKNSNLKKPIITNEKLYNEIMNHPNIKVSKDTIKKDHSKYYIIDDTLILGGINIEDKERFKDSKGRVYQDYMVKIKGKEYIENFINKIEKGIDNKNKDYYFGVNSKKLNKFEMDDIYLSLINQSKEHLLITMAYFTSLTRYIDSILNAYKRGVKVDIMTSKKANFENDANMATLRKLLKESNNNINVYLLDKMVHTKLVMNEDKISLGSTNITNKAFNELDELNLCIYNKKCEFVDNLIKSINFNYSLASKIDDYKKIKYNKVLAGFEKKIV